MKYFIRKIKASEEDKHLLKVLRTSLNVNESQFRTNKITEEEYKRTIDFVIEQILRLEQKYGIQ